MISNTLNKSLQKIIYKNFANATKAKIKFLGKRSLLPHDFHQNNSHSSNSNSQLNKPQESKPIPNNYFNTFTLNSYRTVISNEEIETINNGGPLNLHDWNKIKLKPKVKK